MTYGRVKLPTTASLYPVTLSSIGGDPERSRTLTKGGEVQAKDRDELQALLGLEGAELATEPAGQPATPATSPSTT